MFRRIISLVLIFALGLGLAGCNNTAKQVASSPEPKESQSDAKTEPSDSKDSSSPDFLESYGLVRHAPNMYIEWSSESENAYDAYSADWCCTEDAVCTYWAVQSWDYGYSGFQNVLGKHLLIFSLWNLDDGTQPTIEFSTDYHQGDFGGEGEGKQVYTDFNWKVGTWYSMKVEMKITDGKTIFSQFIREAEGEWTKTASISYPKEMDPLNTCYFFQEDFTFNNAKRSCKVKNATARIFGTDEWESWKTFTISNSFFPESDSTWEDGVMENINFDCDWKITDEYIWVESGGYGDSPRCEELPANGSLK